MYLEQLLIMLSHHAHLQMLEFFASHIGSLGMAMSEGSFSAGETVSKPHSYMHTTHNDCNTVGVSVVVAGLLLQAANTTVVQKLRQRAIAYVQQLQTVSQEQARGQTFMLLFSVFMFMNYTHQFFS